MKGMRFELTIKRIYSMSFREGGQLLACGGDKGYASVYGLGPSEGGDAREALLTWRAHHGWLGDLQFASGQDAGKNVLLTVGNDCVVAAWDPNVSANGTPKRVGSLDCHQGGIFSLHVRRRGPMNGFA